MVQQLLRKEAIGGIGLVLQECIWPLGCGGPARRPVAWKPSELADVEAKGQLKNWGGLRVFVAAVGLCANGGG